VFLTIVLLILNFIYTRANWQTMRLMTADVRQRIRPIPRVTVGTALPWNHPDGQTWILTIYADHAPMVLTGCYLHVALGGPKELEHFHDMKRESVSAGGHTLIQFPVVFPSQPTNTWLLELHYRDLGGLLHYSTSFDQKGFFSESTPVDANAWTNRLRFRWRRWRRGNPKKP